MQEFTRLLSTGVVSASSHALWRVLSNKVLESEYLVTVELTSHTYTSLSETLCLFRAVCFHCHGPPSDSDYVNRSASLQQFWLIHRYRARRSRSARVVTSIRHWIVLFCERYWLAGVGGPGWAQSTKSGGKDIGDGGGSSVKICKLSVRQSPCCLLDFCVLLPVRIKT